MFRRLLPAAALAAMLPLVFLGPVHAAPPEFPGVEIDDAWPDLSFSQPIAVTNGNDGSGMVYVAERPGRVLRIKKWDRKTKKVTPTVFLDIRSKVTGVTNAQGGLLGLCFHPQFRTNRRFFVSYLRANPDPVNKFMLLIEEYKSDGTKALPRGRPILAVRKNTGLHQAGCIGFGPDGKLYIGIGDNAEAALRGAAHISQNMKSPMGKILRIDVDAKPAAGRTYVVPADNPWPSTAQRILPEIWAYGVRNPWRFSWDNQGRMWAVEPGTSAKQKAPAGTKTQEWLQQIVRGGNHGWPYFEGGRQLVQLPPNLPANRLIPKAFAYARQGNESTAGIGGLQYRGSRIPGLRGKYLFGDYGRGHVYALDLVGSGVRTVGRNFRLVAEMPNIGSLGEDEDGEVYLCGTEDDGWVAMLVPGS